LDARLLRLDAVGATPDRRALVVVVDGGVDQVRPLADRLLRESFAGAAQVPALELLDRATFETLQRLAGAGVIKLETSGASTLHRSPSVDDSARQERERRRQAAQKLLAEAQRKARMSGVLKAGGFAVEALPSMREAAELTLRAAACLRGKAGDRPDGDIPLSLVETELVPAQLLHADAPSAIARLRVSAKDPATEPVALSLLAAGEALLAHATQAAAKAALE